LGLTANGNAERWSVITR